ncbi:hypothetical protein DPEC_G00007360 [Dallia pectoralis]|uniref:Uncharacterized protein n=1 Tax=Dallia pectoralis TaxID=75939 RepID=A0ACC2HKC1_DALPE|nr:hypothetical protein DPEC_G00007360 [Dallia pectoralis]
MQQELWLRAKSQVLSSLKPMHALRAFSLATPHTVSSDSHQPLTATELHHSTQATAKMSNSAMFLGNSNNAPPPPPALPRTPNLGLRTVTRNHNVHSHAHNNNDRDNSVKAEFIHATPAEETSGPHVNPIKTSRTHQELHKELLLAHKKGKGLCSKPELQQVLERRKKEQTQKAEGAQARTPLEEELLKRQRKNSEREKQEVQRVQEESHLLEFVRVRQNLRKIQAFHKTTHS